MYITDRINIANSQRQYTDEGFLVLPARIARTGIQDYLAFELGLTDREPTDVIRIYRPPEEVFSADSLASFANKPVTDNHPEVLVNSENAKEVTVGMSGNEVVKDGIYASTMLQIMDKSAIKKVEDGQVELSNGYVSDLVWGEGITPDGEKYDAIQRNIKGNHIALVKEGRCGQQCKVSDNSFNNPQEPIMATITIDGVDFEVTDQASQAVKKLQQSLKDSEEKVKDMEEEDEEEEKKKEDELEGVKKDHKTALDNLQAKFDDAKAKIPTPEGLDKLVENRIATRDAVLRICPDTKWEGKDCEALRKEVVADKCPEVDLESVSPEYIRARFDALAETDGSQSTMDVNLSASVTQKPPVKTTQTPSTDARAKMAEDSRNAWKTGAKS